MKEKEIISVQKHHFFKFMLLSYVAFWFSSDRLAAWYIDKRVMNKGYGPMYGLNNEEVKRKFVENLATIFDAARGFRLRRQKKSIPDIICKDCLNPDCRTIPLDRRR